MSETGKVLIGAQEMATSRVLAELLNAEGVPAQAITSQGEALVALNRGEMVGVVVEWQASWLGAKLAAQLRAADPLLPVVAFGAEASQFIPCLEEGADDYFCFPCDGRELGARVRAHLRRSTMARSLLNQQGSSDPRLRAGNIELDPEARQVFVSGELVQLSRLEYELLVYLMRNAGKAISRNQILRDVYGVTAQITTERVDLMVRRLRERLGKDDEGQGRMIVAVPGWGYRLERRRRGRDEAAES